MQPPRAHIPHFFANDSNVSTHLDLLLPYPSPTMSLQDSLSEIHFTDIVRQCEWSRIVDIRSRACGWFRGCSLGQRNFTEVCNNIDKYATALSTLCTALVAEAAVNESSETNTSAPQHTGQFAFCWKSMCDGQDYVSMSLHFENYMAQLLAFCLHMNGATSAHIKSLRMWENEHVKCETRDAAEAFVIQWQTDDVALRATMMKEFHYAVDAARRARKALEEWSTLRAYTGLRYPPELSREFAERLEHLTLFWAHHLFVETNSAGMYTISYNDEMQWTSPLSTLAIDAPAMVAMLRWQNAAASTFYLLLDHPGRLMASMNWAAMPSQKRNPASVSVQRFSEMVKWP